MLDRHIEEEILPFCKKEGMGQVVFSPLAEGILTGKYSQGIPSDSRGAQEQVGQFLRPHLTAENLERVHRLARIAQGSEMSLTRLALAWTLRDPGVSSAIIGASRPEQVRENASASGLSLPSDLQREIERALAS
jgi:aryl-alcohol dehydrogenase-like predicted oxidoreductase